jgi:hypothetical protein
VLVAQPQTSFWPDDTDGGREKAALEVRVWSRSNERGKALDPPYRSSRNATPTADWLGLKVD